MTTIRFLRLVATEAAASGGFLSGDFERFMVSTTPLGRLGTPEDRGQFVDFLASDDSCWVTGRQIVAAGGQTV